MESERRRSRSMGNAAASSWNDLCPNETNEGCSGVGIALISVS